MKSEVKRSRTFKTGFIFLIVNMKFNCYFTNLEQFLKGFEVFCFFGFSGEGNVAFKQPLS